MAKKLFLLDGMALVYRAHFALMARPIYNSKGVNTSALFGFTQTLLDILNTQRPTHIMVAFDTSAPTHRHIEFPDYKAQREAMPEDIVQALPNVRRMIKALNIPLVSRDGSEADDIIGTLVKEAEKQDFTSYMVTPDKDFGQLVSERTLIYKPSRSGEGIEILGLPEIKAKWGVERAEQVIDILALWGDTSDNIPGVPGIGEKTAAKLIAQFGTVENLLARTSELKGKQKETFEKYRDQALLSKRLATIWLDAPVTRDLESFLVKPPDEEKVKALCVEFEFNSIGKRLFGDSFRAGHGYAGPAETGPATAEPAQSEMFHAEPVAPPAGLKSLADVPHDYQVVSTLEQCGALAAELAGQTSFCFNTLSDDVDPRRARLLGLAFCFGAHRARHVLLPQEPEARAAFLALLAPAFRNGQIEKVGHDMKAELGVLKWQGIELGGSLFDLLLVHSLAEPEMRHQLDYLAERFLGYSLSPKSRVGNAQDRLAWSVLPPEEAAACRMEAADVAWQLREPLEPLLKQKGQERVFGEIERPLTPVLVDMEFEGVRVEPASLADFSRQLAGDMARNEKRIHELAGMEFNVNSPKKLGEILFDVLKLADKAKKTKTGQYSTDEQTLQTLAGEHEIVRCLLEYRTMAKLKSTYADTLPETIWPKTGRIHTTYNQAVTTTGRLQSQDPNLQNIPIRTEQGKEIRKAFVPRDKDHLLLSADYSQIELRVIASISQETAMIEAFKSGVDIHTATAAKVYGVFLEMVTPEMRRKAKMVNFGIAYGISAFGLSQRLGIPRKEAAEIIDHYFGQYPAISRYMTSTIEFARSHGYVETVTGRRRYIRDIQSANATVRSAAERNAINAPIQGTAADMIKLAMVNIHRELRTRNLKTRMILQVHDELVFDLLREEQAEVMALVEEKMRTAIPLAVPIVVEMGAGNTWLEAH